MNSIQLRRDRHGGSILFLHVAPNGAEWLRDPGCYRHVMPTALFIADAPVGFSAQPIEFPDKRCKEVDFLLI
jgi:hypothetical protein